MKIYIEVDGGCVGRDWVTKPQIGRRLPLVFVADCDSQNEAEAGQMAAAVARLEQDKTVKQVYP